MVNKEQVNEGLKQLRKISKKRKFSQAVDLILNFKNVDLKKNPIDNFITLPHVFTKKIKICAFVGDEYVNKAGENCDKVLSKSDLEKWSDVKVTKKLGREFDFFIAQANLMGLVATKFGRTLGPLGKMPNPKFGGVVAPDADFKPVIDKFSRSVRVMTKNETIIKTRIAYEDMEDDSIVSNIMHVYDNISHSLPQGEHNIQSFILKMTMSKPIIIGKKEEEKEK